jgi:WD40-like Beta Propeller Repeat
MRGTIQTRRAHRQSLKLAVALILCAGGLGGITATGMAASFAPLPTAGPTGLPDNRGYEMVSPLDKNQAGIKLAYSSASGDKVAFDSTASFSGQPSAPSLGFYLGTRTGPGVWSTSAISPRMSATVNITIAGGYVAFSPDLDYGVLEGGEPALVAGAPLKPIGTNGYLRDLNSGAYQLLTQESDPSSATEYTRVGSTLWSSDNSRIVFDFAAKITPNAPVGSDVYEWRAGKTTLAGILPDGSAAPSGASLAGGEPFQHSFSEDGQKIFFVSNADGSIYVRENGSATSLVNVSERAVPDAYQRPAFQAATADGSQVLFTDSQKLTEDSTADGASASSDLYQYDVATHHVTDLTIDPSDPEGAGVEGVLRASDDDTYIYFAARGQLAAGQGVAGQPNLYLLHNGRITYIATLSSADSADWQLRGSRISTDGEQLLFLSTLPLTGYENNGYTEVYRYDAVSDQLACVSCDPSGKPATASAFLGETALYYASDSHNLSSDGDKVFFNTQEGLVPRDTNEQIDAYEWENGTLYLISSGQESTPSEFTSASPDGSNAFFVTSSQLVNQDTDALNDLYDARVDGGTPPGVTPPICSGTGCQGVAPVAPSFATPASETFNGVGNFTPPPKAKTVKRKSVKKKKPTPRKKQKTSKQKKSRKARKQTTAQRADSHRNQTRHTTKGLSRRRGR